jgi:riboflavin kinase, archaea type
LHGGSKNKNPNRFEGKGLEKLSFKGKVFSGTGQGRKFISPPWVKQQIQEKLGFTPYLGTLNLILDAESAQKKKLLAKSLEITICPEKGYCFGAAFKAYIGDVECAIVVPKVPNYPADVLEVVAAVCLRDHLNLFDSSEVTVTVSVEDHRFS